MRKALIVAAGIAALLLAYLLLTRPNDTAAQSARGPGASGSGGPGGMGGVGAGARAPMTVDMAPASRATIAEELTVVGNLIGQATVDIVPKVAGRLETVNVRLGDSVRQGQVIAQVDDREVREQVRQAEASFEVARATIRQREADLKFAETNLERSRNLYGRQLLPRQSLDDAEARYQAGAAQLDLARAQFEQARARLDELRIALGNTRIVSPVNGFVGSRQLDPGAYASASAPIFSVVDIGVVRLVANLVEKDLRRVAAGTPARVDVDAFPGETFQGRVARLAPVLDPATRTAQMEIEIPNPAYRLKPGMYARVALLVAKRDNALVVPRNAILDIEGRRGVFVDNGGRAAFQPVEVGLQDDRQAEILSGLRERQKVVTTGAAAVREGDPILIAGETQSGRGPGNQGGPAGSAKAPAAAPAR
jgi:RND family efflux transporter MFP subunit